MKRKKVRFASNALAIVSLINVLIICPEINGANYTIGVNAGAPAGPWNRFYEECVGTCHPINVLSSSYGRNIQNALKRGKEECGFRKIRAHGILNSDVGIYSENNGVVSYNWTKCDQIYDKAKALGYTVIVEFSHMPSALASGGQTTFWYNGAEGNVTPPKDWNKWRDLCKNLVLHLEQRYGADEIRNNWAFEVWNEPDLGYFWSAGQAEYFKLYDYAAEGVRLADPLCKVGGPAVSFVNPDWVDDFLRHVTSETNPATGQKGSKCDFVTYHHYSDDPDWNGISGELSSPGAMNAAHKKIVDIARKYNFTGKVQNTEWAPTSARWPEHSDDESAASFAAKTLHLLMGNGSEYPPPAVFSWWVISDIFEEWDAGPTTAFDGSYGMMLRGDKNISDSYDVPKSVYNTFVLMHKMTDTNIPVAGGTTGNGVNGFATLSQDSKSIQILLYNHVDGAKANSQNVDNVSLTVNNIPFAVDPVKVEHWVIDRTRSNAYRIWQGMGSPDRPGAAQWKQLKDAAALTTLEAPVTVTLTGSTFTKSIPINTYSVQLITLTSLSTTSIVAGTGTASHAVSRIKPVSNGFLVEIPYIGHHSVQVYDMHGKTALSLNGEVPKNYRIGSNILPLGAYAISARYQGGSLSQSALISK